MLRREFAPLQGMGQMDKRKFLAACWPSLNSPCGGYVFRRNFI
jgi:hypothetical protein